MADLPGYQAEIIDEVDLFVGGRSAIQTRSSPRQASPEARGRAHVPVVDKMTIPVARIHYLARRIHLLGERPLAELFIELAAGGDFHCVLERYARLAAVADFIRAFGGDRLPAPRALSRDQR